MVLFNQKSIEEANAMVMATAAGHGIFLGESQTRQSFARIEQFNPGVCHARCVETGRGGGA